MSSYLAVYTLQRLLRHSTWSAKNLYTHFVLVCQRLAGALIGCPGELRFWLCMHPKRHWPCSVAPYRCPPRTYARHGLYGASFTTTDGNGWLEHLYWGPHVGVEDGTCRCNLAVAGSPRCCQYLAARLHSHRAPHPHARLCPACAPGLPSADLTYLSFAAVSLPFDPKPAALSSTEVAASLVTKNDHSVRDAWRKAQHAAIDDESVYCKEPGTELNEEAVVARRIENMAWRLMQMREHAPDAAAAARDRLGELLVSSGEAFGSAAEAKGMDIPFTASAAVPADFPPSTPLPSDTLMCDAPPITHELPKSAKAAAFRGASQLCTPSHTSHRSYSAMPPVPVDAPAVMATLQPTHMHGIHDASLTGVAVGSPAAGARGERQSEAPATIRCNSSPVELQAELAVGTGQASTTPVTGLLRTVAPGAGSVRHSARGLMMSPRTTSTTEHPTQHPEFAALGDCDAFATKVAQRAAYAGQRPSPALELPPRRNGDSIHAMATAVAEREKAVGRNSKLLEWSESGTADFRSPSFTVRYPDGSHISPMQYQRHAIVPGKLPMLGPLPHIRALEDPDEDAASCTSLIISLVDSFTGLEVELVYSVFRDYDAITRRTVVHNLARCTPQGLPCSCDCPHAGHAGHDHPLVPACDASEGSMLPGGHHGTSLHLLRVMSATCDFHVSDHHFTTLSGSWAGERHLHTRKVMPGMTYIESRRGTSSHQHNPGVVLSHHAPSEKHGEVYGFNLIYSGNHRAEVEMSESHRVRLNIGIQPNLFQWELNPGEVFESPEVLCVRSGSGLSGMSQVYHQIYRDRLMPKAWRWKINPPVCCSWEAFYFAVNEARLVELANAGRDCNCEIVLVDDGWFRSREDDTTSLGDWVADERKLPHGLEGLCERINAAGMHFGLWLEPEMISTKSQLFRDHGAEWCLGVPGREVSLGRNQLVLDFGRSEVVDHMVGVVSDLLNSCDIRFLKLDHNRSLSEAYSSALKPTQQGETYHRYMLGVYRFMAELRDRFPNVLIESCAGGGGRFDAGMLSVSSMIWTSDCTDAIARAHIQFGTSVFYPACSMGANVSTVPNHITLRTTSLKTRFLVAASAAYGLELDVTKMIESERSDARFYASLRRELAPIVSFGTMWRLWSPFKFTTSAAWMFVVDEDTLRKAAAARCFDAFSPTRDLPLEVSPTEPAAHVPCGQDPATGEDLPTQKLLLVEQAFVVAVCIRRDPAAALPRLQLAGLQPRRRYRVRELLPGIVKRLASTGASIVDPDNPAYQLGSSVELVLSGQALMTAGLPVRFDCDGDSIAYKLTAVQEDGSC